MNKLKFILNINKRFFKKYQKLPFEYFELERPELKDEDKNMPTDEVDTRDIRLSYNEVESRIYKVLLKF